MMLKVLKYLTEIKNKQRVPTIISVFPPLRSAYAHTSHAPQHDANPVSACVILSLHRSRHTVRVTLTHWEKASVNLFAGVKQPAGGGDIILWV